MLSTEGHYGSLSRQLTQSRLLEWESAANWGWLGRKRWPSDGRRESLGWILSSDFKSTGLGWPKLVEEAQLTADLDPREGELFSEGLSVSSLALSWHWRCPGCPSLSPCYSDGPLRVGLEEGMRTGTGLLDTPLGVRKSGIAFSLITKSLFFSLDGQSVPMRGCSLGSNLT